MSYNQQGNSYSQGQGSNRLSTASTAYSQGNTQNQTQNQGSAQQAYRGYNSRTGGSHRGVPQPDNRTGPSAADQWRGDARQNYEQKTAQIRDSLARGGKSLVDKAKNTFGRR